MAAFEPASRYITQTSGEVVDVRTANIPHGNPQPEDAEHVYDGNENRNPVAPMPKYMAYFMLMRTGFGAGMLGFPLAVSWAGIIAGPIMSIFTVLLVIHSHMTLLNSLNAVSSRLGIPFISFRYGFRICLLHGPPFVHCIGNAGPTIIAVFMLMSQIGICTVFVDFTADSLRDLLDLSSIKTSLLCLIIPYLILEHFMRSLKIVGYISLLGNFMNLVGIILVFYCTISAERVKDVIYSASDILCLSFAFGSFLFNSSAVGVVLAVDKALAKPKIMTDPLGVITVGMLFPAVTATILGIMGYWSLGRMDENILRSLPHDDTLALISISLYLISVALAYPVQCFPAIATIVEVITYSNLVFEPTPKDLEVVQWIARPLFVATTFLICYLAPFQGPFVAFVGNLCTTMVALVFPALMEVCLLYPGPYGKYNVYFIKNILIIVLGMLTWIIGVVLCGHLIYIRVKSSESPNDPDVI